MTSAHAFTDDLSRLDAVATAEAVRAKEVTPEEVVAAAVERVKAVNPDLNAVAAEDYDRALAAARRAGTTGPFAGVPTFIKDGTDVAGLPTRNGTEALANVAAAKHTAPIAQQLFDMGAIGLGKSRLPEFGFIPSTEFPDGTSTHNPWNLDRTPGGSSGGAAALVAAGVVPIAHAQDGGGSTRIPAACNGLVGHKPTRGRLLPDPHGKLLPVKIVFDGVVTRTVRDTAEYYQQADRRYRSKNLKPLGDTSTPIDRSLRVGTFTATPTGAVLDGPTQRVFDETVALLEELGHRVEPVQLPIDEQFVVDFIRYWAMLVYAVDHGPPAPGLDRDLRGGDGIARRHPHAHHGAPAARPRPPQLGPPLRRGLPPGHRLDRVPAAGQRQRCAGDQPPARSRRRVEPARRDDVQRSLGRRRPPPAPRPPARAGPPLPEPRSRPLVLTEQVRARCRG